MAKFRTHYDNLKVSRDAPIEVIQAAYRSLARKYHPDRNTGTAEGEAIMKVINASYEVLSDPAKRAKHDEWIADQLGRRGAMDSRAGGGMRSGDASQTSGGAGRSGDDPERFQRALVTVLISILYFSAAFWMLRNPGLRMVGLIMLVAGWGYFQFRRR